MAQKASSKKMPREPVFMVRPALKRGGLDYLHISLIALVIVLIALALSLSYFKQGTVIKNCSYGIANGTCSMPQDNASQVLGAAEKILAGYAYVNSSISLLPYYSEPDKANVSYIQSQNAWLVKMPYTNPLLGNNTYYFSMLISGSNLSLVQSFYQNTIPPQQTNNSVVSFGTVQIAGKVACQTKEPIPVYLITGPVRAWGILGDKGSRKPVGRLRQQTEHELQVHIHQLFHKLVRRLWNLPDTAPWKIPVLRVRAESHSAIRG